MAVLELNSNQNSKDPSAPAFKVNATTSRLGYFILIRGKGRMTMGIKLGVISRKQGKYI